MIFRLSTLFVVCMGFGFSALATECVLQSASENFSQKIHAVDLNHLSVSLDYRGLDSSIYLTAPGEDERVLTVDSKKPLDLSFNYQFIASTPFHGVVGASYEPINHLITILFPIGENTSMKDGVLIVRYDCRENL